MVLFFNKKEVLFVINVHGDFKTKTNVTVLWCFPFNVKKTSFTSTSPNIMQFTCQIIEKIFIYNKNNKLHKIQTISKKNWGVFWLQTTN